MAWFIAGSIFGVAIVCGLAAICGTLDRISNELNGIKWNLREIASEIEGKEK